MRVGVMTAVVCAAVCGVRASGQPTGQGKDLGELIAVYSSDKSSLERFYYQPWAEGRLERMKKFFADTRAGLEDVNFDGLDQAGKIDYVLLRNEIEYQTGLLETKRAVMEEMEALLPFRKSVVALEEKRWKLDPANPREDAATVEAMAEQIKKAREAIEKGRKDGAAAGAIRVSPVLARRAAGAAGSLRSALEQWFNYHDGFEPEFAWWMRKPYESARGAMLDYEKYLREEIAGIKGGAEDPLLGDPIGEAALTLDLKHEFLPYSAQELIAIGEKELAWCEAEMKKASNEMGLGDDWKAALDKVKKAQSEPGEQDQFVAEQARESIEFLKKHDLITLPPLMTETWRLITVGPQGQKYWPYGAYSDQAMMVTYPTDAMSHADKIMSMRGNNRHFNRNVVPHELIPGHHFQGYMAERIRPYRQAFGTPFFVEGWALYWEFMYYNKGYAKSPEDRIGMLFWRMHRCARITVSLKFHLGQMTPEQMVEFLVERVGHERMGATSEVRRFIAGDYSPLYQCAYMIGGVQIRALREEALKRGMSEKAFHDQMLTYGSIPIELVRNGVLGLPMTRDAKAEWKFAGDIGAAAPASK